MANTNLEKHLADAVRSALKADVEKIANEVYSEAVKELRDRIHSIVAQVAINAFQCVRMETAENQLLITVKADLESLKHGIHDNQPR